MAKEPTDDSTMQGGFPSGRVAECMRRVSTEMAGV